MYRIFICRGENNSAFAYSCESHNARFLVINDSHFCKKLDLDTNPFIQSLDQIALLYTAEDRYEAVRNLTTDQKALFHLYHVDQDDFEHLSRDFNVRNNTASKNPERVLPDRKKPLIVTNSHKRGRRPKTQQDNESSDDTKDHRLFEKQIEYFEEKCRVLVWDAPEHAASWPFSSSFDLRDKARWIDGILEQESIMCPIIVGQSMGGYVGQMYSELFPEKLKGFISIDSAPLQREYVTSAELWLLKRMEPVYRCYPWKALLKSGTNGVATSDYGRKLMRDIMMVYDGQKERYARISGHGFRMLAEAMEADRPYTIKCPTLLICGTEDHAGSCIRYNKAWHRKTGIPIKWIKGAGHNSNTDAPELVNNLIERFLRKVKLHTSVK